MWATIRRKAVSAGSSAVASYAHNLAKGSKVAPQLHHGIPIYSHPLRDCVPSVKTDFRMQKWIQTSSLSESGVSLDVREPIAQAETTKGIVDPVICNVETMKSAELKNKGSNGRISFPVSAGIYGSLLSAPMVNSPQAANMSLGAAVSPTFIPNLALFWHINNGMEEIIADYVHHEMTRSLVLVLMRLFLIVAAKDVFVATN